MKRTVFQLIMLVASLVPVLPSLALEEIPVAAQERFKAGVAIIEQASKPAEFLAAMAEFEAAAALAPRWPEIHYNLARLAAETDKPAKAIKEFVIYLEMVPDATDRGAVEMEIARMREMTARKRKLGLPGVVFAAMPDGIWVMELAPGARVGKTGLRKGCRIIAVEGESLAGAKLDEFFQAIETQSAKSAAAMSEFMKQPTAGQIPAGFSAERGFARSQKMVRATPSEAAGSVVEETGPAIAFTVVAPGSATAGKLFFKQSMFRSSVVEIEEDEFEAEVLQESLPVVVTFWSSECGSCQDLVPAVEAESVRNGGKVKFVNVNVDENRKLARSLAVDGVPAVMVYKGGALVSSVAGRVDNVKLVELVQGVAAN